MKNEGKKFEEDFKESIPERYVFIRLKDGGGWSNAENTRFTSKNECDSILFDGKLFLMLELKSHLGKSIPFTAIKEDQIKSLYKQNGKDNTFPGVIFNFRDLGETWIVHISKVCNFYYSGERKSFPVTWCRDNGIQIQQQLKRTRYKYDIETMLERLKEGA